MQPTRFLLSNLSIKHRLPLLIGTLLLVVIVASTWASYEGVKESALDVGRERLRNLTQQFATLSQQSAISRLNRIFTVANDPVISEFLGSSSTTTKERVVASLQQLGPTQDPTNFRVELWDANDSLVLTIPEGSQPEPAGLESEFKRCATEPFRAVGDLRVVNDTVITPGVAAVRAKEGKTIGHLVSWRQVSVNPQPRQLTDLLGNQATLYFGNTQNHLWTDLTKVVPKPPVSLDSNSPISHYTRDGNSFMALGRPITGTPWSMVMELSDQAFVNQTSKFLRRMVIIGAALLGLGIAGAFLLSRSITRPLNLLTGSASTISSRDYASLVHIRRTDELGALGNAFNSMVLRLRDSQLDLERKVQELKLAQESASKLAAIVESSQDAIIGRALDGTITSWNKGASQLYGYSAEEVVGRQLSSLFPQDRPDEVGVFLERFRRGESIDQVETERIAKDGKRIPVSLIVSPIPDERGAISGTATIARDITASKLAEEELRRTNRRLKGTLVELQTKTQELAAMTQQLWQASKLATLGELSASVAHELNNPLATISLRLESLADQLAADEQKSRAVQIVTDEVERMGKLVGSLLEFSRRGHQQISTIDIREEIEQSVELIEYYLRSRRIDVVKDFEANLPTVQADRQQLRQVFLNLLTNASDAMPEGGRLIARVRKAQLENGVKGVRFEFADAGTGIAPAELEKIWEPFFTTKPEGKGTGLGLAICRRVIEEHQGSISIESQPGVGTTVTIFLPSTNGKEKGHT